MWYIILGIIMIIFSWMQAAFGKMQKYKNEARAQWTRIDALLQTRSSYILSLLKLVDNEDYEERNLLADIYDLNGGYSTADDREVVSAQAEAVTPLLDGLFESVERYQKFKDNEDIKFLISELIELEETIELECSKYNNSIDLYNEHREKPSLRLQVAILGAPPLKGFHIRTLN